MKNSEKTQNEIFEVMPSEKAVLEYMKANNIKKKRFYITAFVNESQQQSWGYCLKNLNSDYYYNQKTINRKTKDFVID